MTPAGVQPKAIRPKGVQSSKREKTFATDWQQTAEVNNTNVNIARQDKDAYGPRVCQERR